MDPGTPGTRFFGAFHGRCRRDAKPVRRLWNMGPLELFRDLVRLLGIRVPAVFGPAVNMHAIWAGDDSA